MLTTLPQGASSAKMVKKYYNLGNSSEMTHGVQCLKITRGIPIFHQGCVSIFSVASGVVFFWVFFPDLGDFCLK